MDINNTIPRLFEEQAHRFPHHVAALYGTEILTYRELNDKANQLAHYLHQKKVKPEAPIALCLPRSFDFLITIMAILKAGGAYLPIDTEQPEERLLFLLHDSKAPILITHSNAQNKFSEYQGDLIFLDSHQELICQQPTEDLVIPLAPQQLAYIIYS